MRERCDQRVVLHSRKGCLQGYKPGQMAAYKVSFLRDMNLLGSPRMRFGLLRVELITGLGCRELAVFSEDALISHRIVAYAIDSVCVIGVLFAVQLRSELCGSACDWELGSGAPGAAIAKV
jgi:hypothetical protein